MDEVTEVATEPDTSDDLAPAEADDPCGRLARIIESVLFAAGSPVSFRRLVDLLEGPTPAEVQAAVRRLRAEYAPGQRGIQLHDVAGGYQLRTARENASWVRAVFRDKPARLGRATLETLAVVAYKQPVTRAEIEAIRGVDVEGVLSTLLSRKLIKIAGRKEAVGRPLLYTTTAEFLETFGLKDLQELPSLKELGPLPEGDDGHTTSTPEPPAASGEPSTAPAAHGAAAPAAAVATASGAAAATGAPAEDPEPRGDRLAAQGGGADSGGARTGERAGGDAAGHEGEPADRPDHD